MLDERGRSGHSASIGNKMSLRCARSHKRMLPLILLLLLLHCCDSFVVSDVRFACARSLRISDEFDFSIRSDARPLFAEHTAFSSRRVRHKGFRFSCFPERRKSD